MKKIVVVFGTRPEVIKLYPVIKALGKNAVTVYTGQHVELANQMLTELKIQPKYSLNVMEKNQTLTNLTIKLHKSLETVYNTEKPDIVVVQGDTTTALVGALQAYYQQIPVAHVEAGLRSGDIYAPFPEEGNRKLISQIATYHFAPTHVAKNNLLFDGIEKNIEVVGNPGIDTLLEVSKNTISTPKCQVLVTLHRRESFGKPVQNVIKGLTQFLDENANWKLVWPVHLNPKVAEPIYAAFGTDKRVSLLSPQPYKKMVKLMMDSAFIITDSGGIQEEAVSLNRPVILARNQTDRPESVDVGATRIAGTDIVSIRTEANRLAREKDVYNSMINKENPYGDGKAGIRIAKTLLE